ncbi:MAG: putative inorganic carbon transporter subunit DabA [Kangiellaceae bacterium]|nr:putative inorganic carbon transporter subunit DabA [Kangiellaceae bacterium]
MNSSVENLDEIINEAAEPVSQFWPMKGFVSHNPLMGLEHLPFDEAFRQAKQLFGAEGYLPIDTYRQAFQSGRIKPRSIDRALARLGPSGDEKLSIDNQTVSSSHVQRLHFLHGIDAIDPALLDWQLNSGGALEQPQHGADYQGDLSALWQAAKSIAAPFSNHANISKERLAQSEPAEQDDNPLPFRTALSDWLDAHCDSSVVADIDQQIIKWTSSFTDEGMASWNMPGRSQGFYSVWRELSQHDISGRLLGISKFGKKVAGLPDDPYQAIEHSLTEMAIPTARWPDYLTRVLAQLPGWTGLIRWRGLNQADPIQRAAPIDVVQYLAVRLFYEHQLVAVAAQQHLGCDGTVTAIAAHLPINDNNLNSTTSNQLHSNVAWRLFHLAQLLDINADDFAALDQNSVERLLQWLDQFSDIQQQPVWLEAYEDSFRVGLLEKIKSNHGKVTSTEQRPLAQAAFCIDVRSEPFRRHLESAGEIETLGYAGFFGIPLSHRSYDVEESLPLCPVLLSPGNAVFELPRAGQEAAVSRYAAGSRWIQTGVHLFHEMKHSPVASFILVDILGLFFSAALLGKTLFRNSYNAVIGWVTRFFRQPIATEISPMASEAKPATHGEPEELARGFSIEQQAGFVEGGLRMIGLTQNYGRFVVLCGHGSTTDNNPYSAALDCGACGGATVIPTRGYSLIWPIIARFASCSIITD